VLCRDPLPVLADQSPRRPQLCVDRLRPRWRHRRAVHHWPGPRRACYGMRASTGRAGGASRHRCGDAHRGHCPCPVSHALRMRPTVTNGGSQVGNTEEVVLIRRTPKPNASEPHSPECRSVPGVRRRVRPGEPTSAAGAGNYRARWRWTTKPPGRPSAGGS